MSKSVKTLLSLGLALGLLLVALAGAAKPPAPPPPTCPMCPIVYSQSASGGRADLVLMQPDGSQKTLLLAGARNVSHTDPLWAPDGAWISFKSNRDGRIGIWLIRPDGSGLRKLVAPCDASTWWLYAAWRPGPEPAYWLAYQDRCGGRVYTDVWAVGVNLLANPIVVSAPACLTCAWNVDGEDSWSQPAWTNDGSHVSARRLLGSTGDYDAEYVLFDFVDGDAPALESPRALNVRDWGILDPRSIRDGAWAHGRNTLIARDVASGSLWTFEVNVDAPSDGSLVTSALELTAAYPGWSFWDPCWSPDDDVVLFGARSEVSWGLFVAPATQPFSGLSSPIAPSTAKGQAGFPDWKAQN